MRAVCSLQQICLPLWWSRRPKAKNEGNPPCARETSLHDLDSPISSSKNISVSLTRNRRAPTNISRHYPRHFRASLTFKRHVTATAALRSHMDSMLPGEVIYGAPRLETAWSRSETPNIKVSDQSKSVQTLSGREPSLTTAKHPENTILRVQRRTTSCVT